MKFKYNKKLIIILLSGCVLSKLTGCNNKANDTYTPLPTKEITSTPEPTYIPIPTNTPTPEPTYTPTPTNTPKPEPTYTPTPNKNETVDNENYTNNDLSIIETLNDLEKNISEELKDEKSIELQDKAKATFILLTDFIFFDGEIKGIKFNDLTTNGKAKVLNIASSIDFKIENKFPGYKENISSSTKKTYKFLAELINKGSNNINDFIKEKISEEHYQAICDDYDQIKKYTSKSWTFLKDFSTSTYEKGKEYIKTWYEKIKNSN